MAAHWVRPIRLRVWGEFACFTRPELKVERVSYAVMTPSAARGLLESIFWRPQIRWVVQQIAVLRPIRFQTLVRNEIASKQSVRVAAEWARNGGGYAAPDDRTQRQTVALRDVAYVIQARIAAAPGYDASVAVAARDQMRRRLARGRCFHGPYLGCREFRAYFAESSGDETPIAADLDLGTMLYDLVYAADGRTQAQFFHAELRRGILTVPPSVG